MSESHEIIGRLGYLGSHVKSRRGSKSLRGIAAEIGVSSATLSRIERGRPPDLVTFKRVCEWLQVSPSWFLGHDKEEVTTNEYELINRINNLSKQSKTALMVNIKIYEHFEKNNE